MQRVRLIRSVDAPGRSGPQNGQYALQKALRDRSLPWLAVGGALQADELPWFWCWADREWAVRWAAADRPFVLGPNVLFVDSRRPCGVLAERLLCDAASCRVLFTESEWYRDLIQGQRGPRNQAPIVIWPYPIDPRPGGPLWADHELLIYAKSGHTPELVRHLQRGFPRSSVVCYGRYQRQQLWHVARRSRACVYLSDDDRGPLALAEILLAGCPVVGVARGAPFVRPRQTGVLLDRFDPDRCLEAVAECLELDRQRVAAVAAEQFDTERIVERVLGGLRAAATGAEAAEE